MVEQEEQQIIHPATPYDGYQMMLDDYRQTRDGDIGYVDYYEGSDGVLDEDSDPTRLEALKSLRTSIARYGMGSLFLDPHTVAHDLGITPETLHEELITDAEGDLAEFTKSIEFDDKLIELASRATKKALQPESAKEATFTVNLDEIYWSNLDGEVDLHTETVEPHNGDSYEFIDLIDVISPNKVQKLEINCATKLNETRTTIL